MIWYSSAHWSMANCTVSLFFTSLHIPTFKLLKLDLRTWIHSNTLSFRGKPLGCSQVNEHGLLWQKKFTWENTNTFYHILYTSNTTKLPCHSVILCLCFLKYLCFLSDTCFHGFGYILYQIQMKQPHRNWKAFVTCWKINVSSTMKLVCFMVETLWGSWSLKGSGKFICCKSLK